MTTNTNMVVYNKFIDDDKNIVFNIKKVNTADLEQTPGDELILSSAL